MDMEDDKALLDLPTDVLAIVVSSVHTGQAPIRKLAVPNCDGRALARTCKPLHELVSTYESAAGAM